MNAKEKKEAVFQFVEFIQAVKSLLFLIKKKPDKYKDLKDLATVVSGTLEKYYLNLDLCESCGHPIPTLPSRTRYEELETKFLKYIKTYETLTGEAFDLSLLEEDEQEQEPLFDDGPNPNFQFLDIEALREDTTTDKVKRPLVAAPRLQQIAEKDKKPVIEAQLISIK
jgi:hypothetical protein